MLRDGRIEGYLEAGRVVGSSVLSGIVQTCNQLLYFPKYYGPADIMLVAIGGIFTSWKLA